MSFLSCDYTQRGFKPLEQECVPEDIYEHWQPGEPHPYYLLAELEEQKERAKNPEESNKKSEEAPKLDFATRDSALDVTQRCKCTLNSYSATL